MLTIFKIADIFFTIITFLLVLQLFIFGFITSEGLYGLLVALLLLILIKLYVIEGKLKTPKLKKLPHLPVVCPKCKKVLKSPQSLGGHMSSHRAKFTIGMKWKKAGVI